MRSMLVFSLLIGLVACSAPRPGSDYTVNKSRTYRSVPASRSDRTPRAGAERNSVVEFAESLIGARYRYGGDSPQRGFDCSGFTRYVMESANIHLPRTSDAQSKAGKRKDIRRAESGDLIFFGHGNRVTHVGIVITRSKDRIDVVHSTSSRGVVRDNILGSDYWRHRLLWAVDLSDL